MEVLEVIQQQPALPADRVVTNPQVQADRLVAQGQGLMGMALPAAGREWASWRSTDAVKPAEARTMASATTEAPDLCSMYVSSARIAQTVAVASRSYLARDVWTTASSLLTECATTVELTRTYSVCVIGSDCSDCGPRDPSDASVDPSDPVVIREGCMDTCEFADDGACDDGGASSQYNVCAFGSDCSDCGARDPNEMPVAVEPVPVSLTPCADLTLLGDDGEFLGVASSNEFETDGVCNEFSNYGSEFSSTSIYNEFSNYGSEFSPLGAYNEFTSTPPFLYCASSDTVMNPVTKNSLLSGAVDPDVLCAALAANGF